MAEKRWDGDTRGAGAGSGAGFVPAAMQLVDAMNAADWVAEDPEAHLLPHLSAACSRPGSPWRLLGTALDGVTFIVELDWQRTSRNARQLTVDVFSLLGVIAESHTHVREHREEGAIVFDVTTGMLAGDSAFLPHGHVLRLRIAGEAVAGLLRRQAAEPGG
jgi:hypothetical protein